MEDLESFLGFAIPRLTWPQAKTHGTQTGQEGQNSAASEQIQAANDTSGSHLTVVKYTTAQALMTMK